MLPDCLTISLPKAMNEILSFYAFLCMFSYSFIHDTDKFNVLQAAFCRYISPPTLILEILPFLASI